jgi:putative component of membrane protein insertase Oxa1/YidC/SpoIIIJ protein YidD
MQAIDPTPPKGLIATAVEVMVPVMNLLDRLGLGQLGQLAVTYSLRVYQTYLSPRKGFSCAHRHLYGQLSCSEYFRQTILDQGFNNAVPLFQQRLIECYQANRQHRLAIETKSPLQEPEPTEEETIEDDRPKEKPKQKDDACSVYDFCEILNFIPPQNGFEIGICDVGDISLGACDMGACDIGACDIGACDIGACDCNV